jgi:hypothetical protein
MDELEIIKTKGNMQLLYYKIEFSLNEIKEKRPDKTDYIIAMTESLIWILEAIAMLSTLEKELRTYRSRCFDLELINLQLISENKRLTNLVTELTNKINL